MDNSDENAAYLKTMLASSADNFDNRRLVYLSEK